MLVVLLLPRTYTVVAVADVAAVATPSVLGVAVVVVAAVTITVSFQ